jgi:hypothetical protein
VYEELASTLLTYKKNIRSDQILMMTNGYWREYVVPQLDDCVDTICNIPKFKPLNCTLNLILSLESIQILNFL